MPRSSDPSNPPTSDARRADPTCFSSWPTTWAGQTYRATARPRRRLPTSTGLQPPGFATPRAIRQPQSARRRDSGSTRGVTRVDFKAGLQEPIPAPSEIDGIPLDHPTIATQISAAGYDTAMIGKWHCGFLPWFSPTRLGWDEFFGNFSGGIDYFSKISHTGAYDLFEDEVEYRGSELLHPHPRRSRDRLHHPQSPQAVAAQPQLHDSALALGRARTTKRSASSSRPGSSRRARRQRAPASRRRLARQVRRDGGGPRSRRRQGDPRIGALRPATQHTGGLRQRQRRRALLVPVAVLGREAHRARGRSPGADHRQLAWRDPASPGRRHPGHHL